MITVSKEEISRRGRRGVKGKGELRCKGQLLSVVRWATQTTALLYRLARSLPWFSERPRWMWMKHERERQRERNGDGEREWIRGCLLWPETFSNCCLLNPPCCLPLPTAERLCCTCWPDFACVCVYLHACGCVPAYVCLWGRLWWWHSQTLVKSWWVFLCHRVCARMCTQVCVCGNVGQHGGDFFFPPLATTLGDPHKTSPLPHYFHKTPLDYSSTPMALCPFFYLD